MQKAIVTGANGFVGSALCRELCRSDFKVIAIVRSQASDISQISNLENIEIVYCELSHIYYLQNLIKDRDIDIFYHLAWEGSAGPGRGNSNIQTDNIQYACDAVKVCAEINCRKFVFASSIMAYEVQNAFSQNDVLGINTIYSSAKMAADYMLRAIAANLGIEYNSGIISNIYGPGENSPRLINSTLRKLLKGEHCSFSSGEQLYDFIYIDDSAIAFKMIGIQGVNGKAYYIGNSKPRQLKQFLIEMRDMVNPAIELGLGEYPSPTTVLSFKEFDTTLLTKDTGFVPATSFETGITNTLNRIKEEEHGSV